MVVYSGDGDLFAIGGNHLIHAARRNVDIKVVCVNNLIYAMTGGQTAPTTPGDVITSTNPYGTYDPSFNLPYLVEAAGAVYVARWTTFHVRQLARSMQEMFTKKGFSFIEVISPCPTLYQRRNKMGDGLDTMKFYKEVSKIKQRSADQRSRADQERRDHRRQVCGPRAQRLSRSHARPAGRCSGRRLRGNGGLFMPVTEIRIAGFGGQGVILSAIVIGKAGCIYRRRLFHHDAELRAGSARRSLQRAAHSFRYARCCIPMCTRPDMLVVMSQEAYSTLRAAAQGRTAHSSSKKDLVRDWRALPAGVRVYSCPATRIAEELGKKMVLNIVMVGFFGAVTGLLQPDSLRNAIADSVPEAYRDLNRKAFDRGYEYGIKTLNGEIPVEEQEIEVATLET